MIVNYAPNIRISQTLHSISRDYYYYNSNSNTYSYNTDT